MDLFFREGSDEQCRNDKIIFFMNDAGRYFSAGCNVGGKKIILA
jgi:hypothetical protein